MKFYFLAVEKTPPYACAVYELDEDSYREGLILAYAALDLYKSCQAINEWPGYPSGVQKLRIPSYGFRTCADEEQITMYRGG